MLWNDSVNACEQMHQNQGLRRTLDPAFLTTVACHPLSLLQLLYLSRLTPGTCAEPLLSRLEATPGTTCDCNVSCCNGWIGIELGPEAVDFFISTAQAATKITLSLRPGISSTTAVGQTMFLLTSPCTPSGVSQPPPSACSFR